MPLQTTTSIVDYLKSQNKPSDYGSRSKLYGTLGLESKYGTYVGSGQQNTGMLNVLSAQATQLVAPVTPTPTQPIATQPTLESIQAGIKQAQTQVPTIQAGIQTLQTQPVQPKEGEIRTTATGGQEMYNPEGVWQPVSSKMAEWQKNPVGQPPTETPITPTPTTPTTPVPEATKVNVTTPDVQMPTTDITSIINDITTGAVSTPESVLAGQVTTLLQDTEKAAASKALTTMQQNLAKRGMTFSGIRTDAEAQLASESLAKMSGISLDAASNIIKAARQEQTRRERALSAVQEAQNSALKSMGYVVNPFTGTIEKTLERERFEEPVAVKTFTSAGNIFQYDPNTGEMTMLYEAPEKEKNYQYFTDVDGNVTRYDPNTGETENLGPLARGTTETLTERDRAIKVAAFAKARIALEAEASKTADGFVYDTTYMRLRADYGELMGNTDDFDDMFAPMLSQYNRLKLGVGKTVL